MDVQRPQGHYKGPFRLQKSTISGPEALLRNPKVLSNLEYTMARPPNPPAGGLGDGSLLPGGLEADAPQE